MPQVCDYGVISRLDRRELCRELDVAAERAQTFVQDAVRAPLGD
jgi:hypothetical protein